MSAISETLSEQISKAAVLAEALPYIQQFRGRTFLVKLGGSAMENPALLDALIRDIVLLEAVGINPVIVHGGGKSISAAMTREGIEPRFVSGQRVTDEQSIAIVEHTLGSEVNPQLVDLVKAHGGRAVGVAGRDVFLAERMHGKDDKGNHVDLGFVGHVTNCRVETLEALVAYETIPVVSPISVEQSTGLALNTNADIAASALARAMKVAKLVYISDVLGVMGNSDDPQSLIHSIRGGEVEGLAEKGIIHGGMLPKLRSAVEAIEAGVGKVHLVDGRIGHSLLLEIFTKSGVGTEIVP